MHCVTILLASVIAVKSQDFASLLGGFLGGGGAGGGGGGSPLGGILASLGGGGAGGKGGPDIASLLNLGGGLLGKGGGGSPFALPGAPNPAPAPRGGGGIKGPTNVAVPDYSEYEEETVQAATATTAATTSTAEPDALPPPNSMTWMQGEGPEATASEIDSDYDMVGMTGPGSSAPSAGAPPPPPAAFTPIGRSAQRAPNPVYHNPRARTFVVHEATLPPLRVYPPHLIQPPRPPQPPQPFIQQPPPQSSQFIQQPQPPPFVPQPPPPPPTPPPFIPQPAPPPPTPPPFVPQPPPPPPPTPPPRFPQPAAKPFWNWAPPLSIIASTVAPIKPVNTLPPFTLPPLQPPTTPSPKLLAHNTARMIREIATFSDHHHGANEDYSAVQTLMEAFFEAIAGAKPPAAAQDPGRLLQPLNDGTEVGANRPLVNKLFESDMVLTVEQMKGVVLASKAQRQGGLRRGKRKGSPSSYVIVDLTLNSRPVPYSMPSSRRSTVLDESLEVITGAVYRWPRKPIPYRFKEGDEKWRNLIRSALKTWEKETCVRWEENGHGKDHVIFFRGSGCYSSVGRTGGSQMISIGYGCEDKGIVCHEVGHSLGFWHEQSRPDRDQYISLNKQYIIRGTDGNFERRTTQEIEDMGLPYDLGSVMHYGPNMLICTRFVGLDIIFIEEI
ncbi:unnamed protein product [Cylicocyclus nassatus]|uniref:Metalloendopeptidase n=1 Tax=Cylicocyclus nassatus TaxID=53992 RepID=A0AA36GNB6_CYLNA|nr:unnamed protein product [Cylicocyclus nassatus]